MAFALPGLFDFSTGVSSAINQNQGRLANQGQVTSNYLNTLNAFNQSLNTNDNLELRQGFAQQPAGTSILDRFSNFAQQTNNPFAANQAVTAGSALSPLLGLTALQNPLFGQQQGLPGSFQGQVGAGLFGATALGQQQFNQQLPALLGTQNQGLDLVSLMQMMVQTGTQQMDNDKMADYLRLQQFEEAAKAAQANSQNGVTTSNQPQTTSAPRRITAPLISTNRAGTFTPDPGQAAAYQPPQYGGNANSRTGD